MKNAEEVLDFLLSSISLSTYDRRFLANIQMINVLSRKPITSNQAELFKKITRTYSRQIFKCGHNSLELATLPWSLKVIPSLAEYTNANIKLVDGELILRTPYHASFITDYRASADLMLKWHSDEKYYKGPFGLAVLKNALVVVEKHFGDITCCDQVTKILEYLKLYKNCRYWDPTLVKRNDRLYILACNNELCEAITHIELDTSLPTLARLSSYGIQVDPPLVAEIINDLGNDTKASDAVYFAINLETVVDLSDLPQVPAMLNSIACDHIVITNAYQSQSIKSLISHVFDGSTIPIQHYSNSRSESPIISNKDCEMAVLLNFSRMVFNKEASSLANKRIVVSNSNPITHKL